MSARIFEYYAGAITKFGGQTIPVSRGGLDFTLRQSMGVVACIVRGTFRCRSRRGKLRLLELRAIGGTQTGDYFTSDGTVTWPKSHMRRDLPAGVLQVLSGEGRKLAKGWRRTR